MLVHLNLTAPPLLLLLLPAAAVGNYTLPAPPTSDIAAFNPRGVALPTWVVNDTLYVLQGGDPAVAIYVPRFENNSGVYRISVKSGDVVIHSLPGVMIEQIDRQPAKVEVNKTGLYLYLTAPVTVTYYFFTLTTAASTTDKPPTTTPTATTTTSTAPPVAPTPVQIPATTAAPVTPQQAPGLEWLAVVGVAAAAAGAVAYALKKKAGGDESNCADLNAVDKAILEALARRGGAADRVELQEALGLPKTTLHRHLHKLAKYGYVKLVQQGGRQRVELLRKC